MNEQEGILELVEMLYTMVSEAWGVPLGNDKCLIDRNKALDLIEEIKNKLPAEITEAKRLVSHREEFISNTKREGESVRKKAEEHARKLVEEQEIVKQARMRAAETIAAAEAKSGELRRAANAYVSEALGEAEASVAQALETIHQSRAKYQTIARTAQRPSDADE